MKIYAVCIGRKRSLRYVSYGTEGERPDLKPLAVYCSWRIANNERNRLLDTLNHKEVYVVPFFDSPIPRRTRRKK